jgi:hypothetical protein
MDNISDIPFKTNYLTICCLSESLGLHFNTNQGQEWGEFPVRCRAVKNAVSDFITRYITVL